jgi:iron complex transport system permease protein
VKAHVRKAPVLATSEAAADSVAGAAAGEAAAARPGPAPATREADEHSRAARRRAKSGSLAALLAVLLFAAFVLSLCHGYYRLSPGAILGLLGSWIHVDHSSLPEAARIVILNVRLPRVASAMLIGGALSMAGAGYQGMFRNPLVSPDILGAAAGAAFGAALGILLSQTIVVIQLMSLAMGLGAVLVSYVLAGRLKRSDPILTLVLTGLVVTSVFSALISWAAWRPSPAATSFICSSQSPSARSP